MNDPRAVQGEVAWVAPVREPLDLRSKLKITRDVLVASLARSRSRVAEIDLGALAAVEVPRGGLGTAAEAACEAHSPPWLREHALRTWLWAAMIALRDDAKIDRELLYVACLLHDLGLCPAFAPAVGGCFAVSGARVARELACEHGADPAWASRLADAIALHLEVKVSAASGPESRLLQAGAMIDVVGGAQLRSFDDEVRRAVMARHPDVGFVASLCECLGAEARRSPHSRVGFYCRRVGFLERIEKNPLHRRARS